MPYLNHSLLVFGGSWSPVAIDQEIWTTSVRLSAGFTSEQSWESVLDDAVLAVTEFVNSTVFPNICQCEYVKVNPIGTDGKYADPNTTYERFFDVPVAGLAGGQILPLQNTVAVTLQTARSRGIGSKGRMFLPGVMAENLDAAGYVSAQYGQNIADTTAAFLADLTAWTGDYNGVPVVASRGANNGAGEGVSEPVTDVTVGSVVDTQRRRRNALTETRYLASLVP